MPSRRAAQVGFLDLTLAPARESVRILMRDHQSKVMLDGFLSKSGNRAFTSSVRALIRSVGEKLKRNGTTHLEHVPSVGVPENLSELIRSEFEKKGIKFRPRMRAVVSAEKT